MTRTQLYLPESQYEELKKLAVSEGKTFASLVRDFLTEKIKEKKTKKRKKEKKNAVELMLESLKDIEKWKGKEDIRDGSINHDYYLYGMPKRDKVKK